MEYVVLKNRPKKAKMIECLQPISLHGDSCLPGAGMTHQAQGIPMPLAPGDTVLGMKTFIHQLRTRLILAESRMITDIWERLS